MSSIDGKQSTVGLDWTEAPCTQRSGEKTPQWSTSTLWDERRWRHSLTTKSHWGPGRCRLLSRGSRWQRGCQLGRHHRYEPAASPAWLGSQPLPNSTMNQEPVCGEGAEDGAEGAVGKREQKERRSITAAAAAADRSRPAHPSWAQQQCSAALCGTWLKIIRTRTHWFYFYTCSTGDA